MKNSLVFLVLLLSPFVVQAQFGITGNGIQEPYYFTTYSGLVADVPYSESYGNTFVNYVGDGLQDTICGATWHGKYLSFDGIDDYAKWQYKSSYQMTTTATWMFWIYSYGNNGQYQDIMRYYTSETGFIGWLLYIDPTNNLLFFASNFDNAGAFEVVPMGINITSRWAWEWAQITVTWNSGTFTTYVDGEYSTTATVAHTSLGNTSTAQPLVPFNYFAGMISKVKIWNTCLPQNVIRKIFSMETPEFKGHRYLK
jgi:hypothetical protein